MDLPTITRSILVAGHMKYNKTDFAKLLRYVKNILLECMQSCESKLFILGKITDTTNRILLSHMNLDAVKKEMCKVIETAEDQVVLRLFNGDPKYNNIAVNGWQYCYYFLYEYESKITRSQPPLSWASSDRAKINTQEHILPNSHRDGDFWETEWPDENQAEKYKHRLGNLVLTDGNVQLGRKSSLKLNGPGDYFYNCSAATNRREFVFYKW